tara:strand:- start:1998 stop:2408 length:411 start_codon:yes stop_codon:yes gene_type:complete
MIDGLIDRLKISEGFRDRVYKCTEGFDTIGYGFAIKDLVLSEEISEMILKEKVEALIGRIESKFDWFVEMPPEVQSVIVECCYQLGVYGWSCFKKTIHHMKEKEFKHAADEMLDSRWAKQTPNRANMLAQIVREHG